MDISIARPHYNATGRHPKIDYRCEESHFAVDRIQSQLQQVIAPEQRVLILGCHAGRFCFAIEEMGAFATGIDCAEGALSLAREIALERQSRSVFVQGDFQTMPFAENSFDVAILLDIIVECSYEEIERLCACLHTVLSPQGSFCVGMYDGLIRTKNASGPSAEYEMSTGRTVSMHTVQGKGPFPYHSYFWTLAFAKHVIGRHLKFVSEQAFGENRQWLVFRNTE